MSTSYMEVDFLIVSALPKETEAVLELLEEKHSSPPDVIGVISRKDTNAKYVVASTEIGEMGTNAAQKAVSGAIYRLNPKRVILTGIAAGFPEAGVQLGDVLIPYFIFPYELGKICEAPETGRIRDFLRRLLPKPRKVKYEPRGDPMPVDEPLWNAAKSLAKDEQSVWADTIKERRPDGTERSPAVYCSSSSVLGSGDKVVATELAYCRQLLLKRFPRRVIGLEMEAFGALTACRIRGIPFLVIKASQDPATRQKDKPAEKDVWRVYATQAAAAFTIALIGRGFETRRSELLLEHMKEVLRYAQIFERDAPRPPFAYRVSRAVSYALLREGIYHLQSQEPIVLIPNDATPEIALHGGGGTGKSQIVKSFISPLIDEGLCPILVDLRKYRSQKQHGQIGKDPDVFVQDILLTCTVPRRTPDEIKRLAREARLIVLIDGLNEISREGRTALIEYFQQMNREATATCYLLVTDRFGPSEPLETFSHAVVERLNYCVVQTVFDSEFGAGSFKLLDERLKVIYTRPFFLSLALNYKRNFTDQSVWSGIFQEFFLTQLRMVVAQLDKVAKATLNAFSEDGRIDLTRFKRMIDSEVYQLLVGAGVLAGDGSGFVHHLWRDYLVSRYLTQNKNNWKDTVFDAVTTFASSLESLSLTVEQLRNQALKDEFLKAIYDWNYVAAANCIAGFREDDPDSRQLSLSIRSAVLAAIAEKRFDNVKRTRQRATDILTEHRYGIARQFIEVETPESLRRHVATLSGPEDWFKQWKALFTKRSGQELTVEEIALVTSDDSLIGWTATNLARRSGLDEEGQRQIRNLYEQAGNVDDTKSVRWRTVHVLGVYPNEDNVNLLLEAVRSDLYHWVQYGAVRALIEIASQSEQDLRKLVFDELSRFIESYDPPNVWIRRQILREIVETAFIRNPKPGWKDAALPLLDRVVEKETGTSYQDELRKRVSDFRSYDEGE